MENEHNNQNTSPVEFSFTPDEIDHLQKSLMKYRFRSRYLLLILVTLALGTTALFFWTAGTKSSETYSRPGKTSVEVTVVNMNALAANQNEDRGMSVHLKGWLISQIIILIGAWVIIFIKLRYESLFQKVFLMGLCFFVVTVFTFMGTVIFY